MSTEMHRDDAVVLPQLERLLLAAAERIQREAPSPPVVPAAARRRRLRRRSPLMVAVLVCVALLLAAGVATAVLLITEGKPLAAPHALDLSPWQDPLPGSVRLAGLAAPDPEGGPPWEMRLSRTGTGETCTAVGQLFNGRFGIVGLDHVFRALPVGGVDACGVPGIAGPVLAGARVFAGKSTAEARTIVNGVAGAGTRSVTAYGPEGARRLALGADGSFLTVYRGLLAEVRPRIVVVDAAGHAHTTAFASSTAFEVADPDGGSPWEVSGGDAIGMPGATGDENCAQASQLSGPQSRGGLFARASTPDVCGHLGGEPLFALFRRFNPGDGQSSPYPWGETPSRTLVYGAASLRVRSLQLLGAGLPRALAIDPHDGVFLAVLDGRVDPRSLTLVARLRDGHSVRFTRAATRLFDATTGAPIREAPVPAPYVVSPAGGRSTGIEFPSLEDPIAQTVVEGERAADPAGGPTWVLRSWRGNVDPRARFGALKHPRVYDCWQVGIVQGGRFLQPVPGGTPLPLSLPGPSVEESRGAECRGAQAPDVESVTPAVDTYANNVDAYEPQPARTVVSGVIEPPAKDPMLLGAGAPRKISPGANHAYVIVLGGSYWTAPLRVRALLPGGRVLNSYLPTHTPLLRPQVRAPDPNGTAPWGYTHTALCPSSWSISVLGRVIDDRIASLDESTGQISPGGGSSSTGSPCGTRNARAQQRMEPLFDGADGPLGIEAHAAEALQSAAPSEGEVQRRTLPGQTVIVGRAPADVTSVTLATPADVRTVQPVGPSHVFMVVYDGIFYRGLFTATARFSDGKTVTQTIRGATINPQAEPEFHRRPLAAELRSDRATLRKERAQVAKVERSADPARSSELLYELPLARLLQGVRQIQAMIAGEEARIRYLREHPGILPAP